MKEIFVLMSFRIDKPKSIHESMVDGCRFWLGSESDVFDYIEKAGKPVPGEPGVFYHEPCECACNYLVVEKVMEGPDRVNEVIGWWKYTKKGYVKLNKPPMKNEGTYNFTRIG